MKAVIDYLDEETRGSGPGKKKGIYLLLILMVLPFIGHAAAYWMDVKGSGKINQSVQIKIYYGSIDDSGLRIPQTGPELTLTGEFKIRVIDPLGHVSTVPILLNGNGWEGTFTPHEKGVYQILGLNDTHPVVDRSKTGGKNVLPVDYLCAAYPVESTEQVKRAVQFLDIVTCRQGKQVVVKAFKNGEPVASASKIRVFNPENWEKELVTDADGEAVFLPTMKGLYIIREDWEDPKQGIYQGISYSAIRHRCNYFLLIQ
jgi:hypothetical protein